MGLWLLYTNPSQKTSPPLVFYFSLAANPSRAYLWIMAKVLVADDSAVLLKIARLVFEKAGHAVETAADGQIALERARIFRPDLIVLDAEMPVLSGLEACRALKADPATAAAPVHVYTGHDVDGPTADAFRAAGAVAVHAKPYTPAALLALLPG